MKKWGSSIFYPRTTSNASKSLRGTMALFRNQLRKKKRVPEIVEMLTKKHRVKTQVWPTNCITYNFIIQHSSLILFLEVHLDCTFWTAPQLWGRTPVYLTETVQPEGYLSYRSVTFSLWTVDAAKAGYLALAPFQIEANDGIDWLPEVGASGD